MSGLVNSVSNPAQNEQEPRQIDEDKKRLQILRILKRRLEVWDIEHQAEYGVAKKEEKAREVEHIQQKCSERLVVHIVEELSTEFVKNTVTTWC